VERGTRSLSPISNHATTGKTLIVTGETGNYDETGAARESNPIQEFNIPGARFADYPNCPGKAYYTALQKEFNQDAADCPLEDGLLQPDLFHSHS
jgi:hypothetical protein